MIYNTIHKHKEIQKWSMKRRVGSVVFYRESAFGESIRR